MRDFTRGSVLSHIVAFSLPIIVGDILQTLYILIDAMWVGKLVGHYGLAAVTASTPLLFFLASLIIGLGVSTI